MEIKAFSEIEELFDTSVWVNGREIYWFRKAWECLSKKGLTSFNSREDECLVYIRIATLNMIYREFCELALEESYCYACMEETFEDTLLEIEIGQLYAKYTDNEFIDDFSGNINYALCCLADSQRKKVYDALYSELDLLGMFFGMYFTGCTPDCWLADSDDDENNCIYDERKTKVNNYEEYWNAIFNDADSYMSDFSIEDMEAFGWLCEGTYRIHCFE